MRLFRELALIITVLALIASGCSNQLVLDVNGKRFIQTLPKEVTFPMVIDDITEEFNKKLKDAKDRAEKAKQAVFIKQLRDSLPKGTYIVQSLKKDKLLRITCGAKSASPALPGVLATASPWYWPF